MYKEIMEMEVGKEFEDFDIYGSEWGTEEYNVRCICCGKTVGHWCYGNWQL